MNRRQFVSTITLGTPMLVLEPQTALAQPAHSDPVIAGYVADFQELVREGESNKGLQRGAVRSAESLTGHLATYLSKQYDQEKKRQLRQQLRRNGRQALVQKVTTMLGKPEYENVVDEVITRLDQEGLGGIMRDVQKRIRQIRVNLPPDFLQVRSVFQYDFCSDLNWIIQITETLAALSCALAMGMAGTNPAADATCAATTAALGMYLAMKWWYNC